MTDVEVVLLTAGVGILHILIFFVFSGFTYRTSANTLSMTWRIIGIVPVKSVNVPLEEIMEARDFSLAADYPGGYLFGKFINKKKVVLILKYRRLRYLFAKRIIITPEEPASFIADINASLKQMES